MILHNLILPMTPARLRKARKELGLTQVALAHTMGMAPASIVNMETGRVRISIRTGLAMVCLAGMTQDEFRALSERVA